VPLISGKDSMSNDCTLTDPPISIPPTLLVSVLGRIADVQRAVTVDPKSPGDLLYLLGLTHRELGASEFYRYYGDKTRGRAFVGGEAPGFDPEAARPCGKLHQAMQRGLVRSCHTPALGGLRGAGLQPWPAAGGWRWT
jgi:phosphoribosylformylglycinamidine synthase